MYYINPLLLTDSYKLNHADQYPAGTEYVYSGFTPRSNKYSTIPTKFADGKVVVFGAHATIQYLHTTFNDDFFAQPKGQVIAEFVEAVTPFVGDEGINTSRFEALHDLGYLPIMVKSLDEGVAVPVKTPILTIVNTRPEFFWITNYLETIISAELWSTCTVATIARAYRKILTEHAINTGTPTELVDFQAHDFSARGLKNIYDIAATGAAHATSFKGSDSLSSVPYLNNYYQGKDTFKATSVPATEHSVMSAGSQIDELETYKRLLATYSTGVVAIVSDTWDFWNVITNFMVILKEQILARQPNSLGMAKLVIRPDSGDPADILCGTAIPFDSKEETYSYTRDNCKENEAMVFVVNGKYVQNRVLRGKEGFILETFNLSPVHVTPEMKGAVQCLWEIFGGTVTSTGHNLLDSHIGLIYGDSITLDRADDILTRLANKGFASGNVILGVGSFSYQYITRDTFGFAMKATYAQINGKPVLLSKAPKTDDGTKHSATGLMNVSKAGNDYVLTDNASPELEAQGELKVIYCDGFTTRTRKASLENIRNNVLLSLNE